jgi:hypothetical protein
MALGYKLAMAVAVFDSNSVFVAPQDLRVPQRKVT